ncbi:MAG: DUF378 domain-containing protein [Candidatus Campbellbacteria bacterium]|nr:DUF378 domain-containing protein [Candidatus Campbellbacteria bacterium]
MMSGSQKLTMALIVIGGINWGLVGIGNFLQRDWDVVNWLFTDLLGWNVVTNIVYVVVGIAAIAAIVTMSNCKKQ